MQFCPNFTSVDLDPTSWAHDREAEGYPVVAVADHISAPAPHPHVWVTATAFALATETTRVLTGYGNNLVRSPVEFAQAALMLQQVSGGRAEAGLGAGWAADEITGIGRDFPEARDRAGSYIEAIQVVRQLFDTGACQFEGEYYSIDIPAIGPIPAAAPPLVASCAGPRTTRGVAPYVDRIELMGFSMAVGEGGTEEFMRRMLSYTEDRLKAQIDIAREAAPDVPLGFLALVTASEDPAVAAQADMMGDGLFANFIGSPDKVAASLHRLGELGIERVQLAAPNPETLTLLAPLLCDDSSC